MPLRRIGAAIVLVVLLLALAGVGDLVVDWAWFSSVGYAGVFWTALAAKGALFASVFAVSTLLLWLNADLALRFSSKSPPTIPAAVPPGFATFPSTHPWARPPVLSASAWRITILVLAVIPGLLIAAGEASRWDLALRFLCQAPHGQSDPLFGEDIGFYLFSLPVFVAVKNWLLWSLAFAALMAGAIAFAHRDVRFDPPSWSASPAAIAHGSVLLGLFPLVKAWSYALDRSLLLYDDNGGVVGAGYADVHVALPALWLLIVLAVVGAVAAFANVRRRSAAFAIAAALAAQRGGDGRYCARLNERCGRTPAAPINTIATAAPGGLCAHRVGLACRLSHLPPPFQQPTLSARLQHSGRGRKRWVMAAIVLPADVAVRLPPVGASPKAAAFLPRYRVP